MAKNCHRSCNLCESTSNEIEFGDWTVHVAEVELGDWTVSSDDEDYNSYDWSSNLLQESTTIDDSIDTGKNFIMMCSVILRT